MSFRMHIPSTSRGWMDEGLCAGLSFLGSIAIFELLDKPDASVTLVALLISAAVGCGSGRWIVRSMYPERAAIVSAVVLIAVIIEAGVPAAWHHLLLDPSTWQRVASSLRDPTERTLLAACVLVGLAGAAERVAFGDRDRPGSVGHPALAVLPALILVTWSAAAAPGVVSGTLCGGLIVIGGSLILLGDPVVQQSNTDSVGPTLRGAARRRGITAALLSPLAAFLVVVLSVSVSGAIGTHGSGSAHSSDAPTTEALVTNVVGFAAQDPNVVLFRAHSQTPTYWQVAVLTRQIGGTWEVSPELARTLAGREAASGGDGSDASIGTHSHVTANVTIASYRGRVLPVPLGTATAQGPWPTRSVDDAVVQQGPTTPGEQYVTRGSISEIGQEAASPGSTDDVSSPSIGNPGPESSESIPAEVQLMARQVTAGSEDEAQMVQRLVNWFRSGRFQYSAAAQPVSRETDPVVAFLTRTKVGNCQTFTDAFAMMAQSLGIPVRVAVGFTSGAREPSGETVVTGADAHTWPEVFGGADSGWESVEPTPASSITAIVPPNIRGVAPVPTNTPATRPAPTPISSASPTSLAASPAPTSVTPTVPNFSSEGQSVQGGVHRAPVLWILLACVVLGAALFALVTLVRRRTFRAHVGPRQAVLDAWWDADRSLARLGLGCPRSRTPLDHAHRLREAIFGVPGTGWKFAQSDRLGLEQLVSDVESLALLERGARYGERPTGEAAAFAARVAAGQVRRSLRYHHLGRALRGLNMTSITPGQGHGGTDWGAYASSGHGANHP